MAPKRLVLLVLEVGPHDRSRVGRAAQDDYAARSHQKAARATAEGAFTDEILPITIPQKKGEAIVVAKDEHPRETSLETLATLKGVLTTENRRP